MTIKIIRNEAAKQIETLEAEMTGDVIAALAEFVASREDDKHIAVSVILKAFMHENTSWDTLGHEMYNCKDQLGRKGQQDFFKSVLVAEGIIEG
jgi:hypothetical protein